MIRIVLIAFALLSLSACNRFGGKNNKTTQPADTTTQMTGAYGTQRAPKAEELELFRTVTATLTGVGYTPESVSTQVVAGTNYRFICKAVTVTREPQRYQAEVVIYQPLPGRGEARITKITRL